LKIEVILSLNPLTILLTKQLKKIESIFQIGMFGLELARPPASTKPMEVKLAHQESELVSLLKRIPLGKLYFLFFWFR
jgi:hypothetical protein